jgi:biopolymer transport protein ExbD
MKTFILFAVIDIMLVLLYFLAYIRHMVVQFFSREN